MSTMNLKVMIPFAVIGLALAVRTATAGKEPAPLAPVALPRSPFAATVAGAGLVEARSENVNVGAPVAGIVSAVLVGVGDQVAAGTPLFVLDQRAERAALEVREAELLAAERKLEHLRLCPRPESIAPLEARVREAEAHKEDLGVQLARWEELAKRSTVSEHEVSLKRYAALGAEKELERARAELAEAQAGTWEPELLVAAAAIEVAKAEVLRAEVALELLVVRAPVDARILRVNVRAGERIQPETGAVLLGDTGELHVRVSIDEADVPRFQPGAAGVASVKGLSGATFALRFVRTEPYIVPKRSLTGLSDERVDTRVLEVVYAIEGATPTQVYVGQQVDAFIESTR